MLLMTLSPTVTAANKDALLQARSAPHRVGAAALVAATPDVFQCKTKDAFYTYACTDWVASPFDASAFDYAIGGHTSFDGIVSRYEFKFTAPSSPPR